MPAVAPAAPAASLAQSVPARRPALLVAGAAAAAAAASAVALCAALAPSASAQVAGPAGKAAAAPVSVPDTQVQPEVENSRYQFDAVINASNVLVRSGPGENYYATQKLDKGAPVRVVGIRFEWLKVVPPEGSFSVVAREFIDRRPGTNVGVVNVETLNVRAGSHLVAQKATVQCKLKRGEEVEITGEQEQYYLIRPPAGAYLYVHQQYVTPVKQVPDEPPSRLAGGARGGNVGRVGDGGDDAGAGDPVADVVVAQGTEEVRPPATQPIAGDDAVVDADLTSGPGPATRPAAGGAAAPALSPLERFTKLEEGYRALADIPLEKQDLAGLLAGYEPLVQDRSLSLQARRMAEARAAALRIQLRRQAEFVATLRDQEAFRSRLSELRTRRERLEQRALGIETYAAIGKLQPSLVRNGEVALFRIVDPATDRTLCYVRSEDAKIATLLGRFVGVKGELVSDPQLSLKVIPATAVEEVNPAQVNRTISAQVMPPSLVQAPRPAASGDGRAEQASTGE